MIYFSYLLTFLIFFIIGVLIAKKTTKYRNRYINYVLIFLGLISFWIGSNSFLFKAFNFEIKISTILPALFLGILLKRLNLRYSLI